MEEIPVTKPYFPEPEIERLGEELKGILRSGRFIFGPYTEKFEQKLKEYAGTSHAVAVNTCTTALTFCNRYFNAQEGEIIVPSATFIATPNSALFAGGKPVFAEVKEDDLCLDPADVERKITKKTRAIITVHLVGSISKRVRELQKIAGDHNLPLIEDCAHAIGSRFGPLVPGNLGNAACFSFYPTKVITTGLGGAIATNDEKLVALAKSLRNHGAGQTLWEIVNLGTDGALTELSCALGCSQLDTLPKSVEQRQEISREYNRRLRKVAGVKLFPFTKEEGWNVYRYPVLLESGRAQQAFIQAMKKQGIGTSRIYIPCHLQPFYRNTFGHREGELPVTEDLMRRAVCLPAFPQMTMDQVARVCEAVGKELQE